MTRFNTSAAGLFLVAGTMPLVAYSQTYLTEDQAVKVFFPSGKLTRQTYELTAEEVRKIEEGSGERVRSPAVIAWVSAAKEAMFVDQVLGKHENILYAVALQDHKVKGIEILEYRETYGGDVKKEEWRRQFVGKDVKAPVRLNDDIVNLSGATLSSAHITNGVRRVIHLYEIIRERL